jgi:hypothetical protein
MSVKVSRFVNFETFELDSKNNTGLNEFFTAIQEVRQFEAGIH